MNYIVNGFEWCDRRFASSARVKAAGNFLEAECFPLQHHQRFNLRIFEREAPAEHQQRIAVDAHEAGSRVSHLLTEDGAEDQAEEADTEQAKGTRVDRVPVHV